MIDDSKIVLQDAEKKRARVREYLAQNALDGAVIATREHFAWLTGGGDNHVTLPTNVGFGAVVITGDRHYLVAHTMDADRLIEEQMKDQGYELVKMHWYEGDIRSRAIAIAGKRAGSDTFYLVLRIST